VNPIITNNQKSFDEHEFSEYILKKCSDHKKDGRALAFVFIFFDHQNANITKVLKDKEYWSELDALSGTTLTIFYIDSQDKYFSERQEDIYQKETKYQDNNYGKGTMGYLQAIYPKQTALDNSLNMFKEKFKLDGNIETPFLLFFQCDGLNILDMFTISLKAEKIEESFAEIKTILNLTKYSLSKVDKENHGNHKEIFDLIKNGVKDGLKMKLIKKVIPIKVLIKIISKLHGGI
jgi:hypothetical protein